VEVVEVEDSGIDVGHECGRPVLAGDGNAERRIDL
jgi:hypothetical protein